MTTGRAVAKRVSSLLLDNDMTQYALSMESGLSQQAIANILNEKYTTVKLDTLVKLADGFKITLLEFIDDDVFKRENLDVE